MKYLLPALERPAAYEVLEEADALEPVKTPAAEAACHCISTVNTANQMLQHSASPCLRLRMRTT